MSSSSYLCFNMASTKPLYVYISCGRKTNVQKMYPRSLELSSKIVTGIESKNPTFGIQIEHDEHFFGHVNNHDTSDILSNFFVQDWVQYVLLDCSYSNFAG